MSDPVAAFERRFSGLLVQIDRRSQRREKLHPAVVQAAVEQKPWRRPAADPMPAPTRSVTPPRVIVASSPSFRTPGDARDEGRYAEPERGKRQFRARKPWGRHPRRLLHS